MSHSMSAHRWSVALAVLVAATSCLGLTIIAPKAQWAHASTPPSGDAARSVLNGLEADAFADEGFRLELDRVPAGTNILTAEIPVEIRYSGTPAVLTCTISGGEAVANSGDAGRRFTVEPAIEDETIYTSRTLSFSTVRRFPETGGQAALDCSRPDSPPGLPAGGEHTWITTSAPHLTAVSYERVFTQESTI